MTFFAPSIVKNFNLYKNLAAGSGCCLWLLVGAAACPRSFPGPVFALSFAAAGHGSPAGQPGISQLTPLFLFLFFLFSHDPPITFYLLPPGVFRNGHCGPVPSQFLSRPSACCERSVLAFHGPRTSNRVCELRATIAPSRLPWDRSLFHVVGASKFYSFVTAHPPCPQQGSAPRCPPWSAPRLGGQGPSLHLPLLHLFSASSCGLIHLGLSIVLLPRCSRLGSFLAELPILSSPLF